MMASRSAGGAAARVSVSHGHSVQCQSRISGILSLGVPMYSSCSIHRSRIAGSDAGACRAERGEPIGDLADEGQALSTLA